MAVPRFTRWEELTFGCLGLQCYGYVECTPGSMAKEATNVDDDSGHGLGDDVIDSSLRIIANPSARASVCGL